jgi:hypothetical protein
MPGHPGEDGLWRELQNTNYTGFVVLVIEIPAGLTLAIRPYDECFTRYADAISNRMDWFEKQTTELCTISPLLLVFVGFQVAVAIQIPISGALLNTSACRPINI